MKCCAGPEFSSSTWWSVKVACKAVLLLISHSSIKCCAGSGFQFEHMVSCKCGLLGGIRLKMLSSPRDCCNQWRRWQTIPKQTSLQRIGLNNNLLLLTLCSCSLVLEWHYTLNPGIGQYSSGPNEAPKSLPGYFNFDLQLINCTF